MTRSPIHRSPDAIRGLRPEALSRIGFLLAVTAAALIYFLTVDPSASFWDCPEYALVAFRLEIGHAPGNPAWMLFHNIAGNIADAIAGPESVALAMNICSGIFTALAVGLLYLICFFTVRYTLAGRPAGQPLPAATASLCASLLFAWSDSPWFSAVETEVYAMSLFFTALTVWLMILWARSRDPRRQSRILILIAYLTGLSIGVHELNLLVIPALALIFIFRRSPMTRCRGKAWGAFFLACALIGCILLGMYPGTCILAGEAELFAVNSLNLPFGSGVTAYLILLLILAIIAPLSLSLRRMPRALLFSLRFILIFGLIAAGGFFLFGRNFAVGGILSAIAALLITLMAQHKPLGASTIVWMAGCCLLGYSVYLIIPLRSAANPPVNENAPSDVFSFYSYLKRDQYGKRPLLYGATPYAKPLYKETIDSTGKASYGEVVRSPFRPAYMKAMPGARISRRSGLLSKSDSLANLRAVRDAAAGRDRYLLADYRYDLVYTPELNMILPRLTSHNPTDISNYESWAGMTRDNMIQTEGSFALDSTGQPVGRLFSDGKRTREKMYKPTMLMNLRELFGYQVAYMYFRYLLWNFGGRQNDYPSAGEIEHGNFITGFPVIDNLMLGDQDNLPAEIGRENHGRNPYFMIPFLLGIFGAIAILYAGRRGKRADAVILALFLMTGVAIVAYLNQDPGEPRERDYSFLGSFLAFSIWIALGMARIIGYAFRLSARHASFRTAPVGAAIILFAVPAWMLAVNYHDHDRSGRHAPTDFARNLLESLEPDAIIFVDGDNHTFPLWYAQEVLGVRRDVKVVNLAYLSTAWYVTSLMLPGEESRPIEMQASPEKIFYEAFNVVRLPSSLPVDSSLSVDALGEIRRIYETDAKVARFSSDWLRIPVAGGDSMVVNLRTALGGSSAYTIRELAMLDIVATNAHSRHPRPIYWHDALVEKQTVGLQRYTSRYLSTRRLTPHINPQTDTAAYLCDEAMAFLPRIRTGGTDSPGIYLDPYVGNQVARQRLALLRLGVALKSRGRHEEALRVAHLIDKGFPDSAWPYQGLVEKTGDVWQEGLVLADIYEESGMATGNSEAAMRGARIRREQTARLKEWKRWYNSLPDWQKSTVSSESRRLVRAGL